MVIRAASESDEKEDSEGSVTLSVSDLDEIAQEVRISPEAISNNSSVWQTTSRTPPAQSWRHSARCAGPLETVSIALRSP